MSGSPRLRQNPLGMRIFPCGGSCGCCAAERAATCRETSARPIAKRSRRSTVSTISVSASPEHCRRRLLDATALQRTAGIRKRSITCQGALCLLRRPPGSDRKMSRHRNGLGLSAPVASVGPQILEFAGWGRGDLREIGRATALGTKRKQERIDRLGMHRNPLYATADRSTSIPGTVHLIRSANHSPHGPFSPFAQKLEVLRRRGSIPRSAAFPKPSARTSPSRSVADRGQVPRLHAAGHLALTCPFWSLPELLEGGVWAKCGKQGSVGVLENFTGGGDRCSRRCFCFR